MWNSETNFPTCQAGLQLPGEKQLSPHLDAIRFYTVIYARMEPVELRLKI